MLTRRCSSGLPRPTSTAHTNSLLRRSLQEYARSIKGGSRAASWRARPKTPEARRRLPRDAKTAAGLFIVPQLFELRAERVGLPVSTALPLSRSAHEKQYITTLLARKSWGACLSDCLS
ncbi:uncharacterized protein LOC116853093 [Odontomachus brunneus]|uniref:uncharacterized protein LOC116853093 n=1 Tax=Odontomachus brunneus TaxID=486640 RepID=UPI0013F189BF|nr:uncharacterized protein LOC116853093 [Odontomachus brunneus]